MNPIEQVQKEFFDIRKTELKKIKDNYDAYSGMENKTMAKDYVKKYPFLKRKPSFPSLKEVLTWDVIKTHFSNYDEKMKPLIEHFIAKITGIFKHGQTEKTFLCNLRVISNAKLNILSVCISKNTLSAKEQWEERLLKDLKREFPRIPLHQLILIISSKKNTLDGNATHCKNIREAQASILTGNFKVIFICSNNQRIDDIIELLDSYDSLSVEKRLPMDIQQDEAHNEKEGIPSKRAAVEWIIMSPYVQSFVPVTASPDPLYDEQEPLWKKVNLGMKAIDYTQNSNTISTSENYSSISDAHQIRFQQYQSHPSFENYNIYKFDEETFDEAYGHQYANWTDQAKVLEDKNRRSELEFCQFMAFEREACTLGMNIFDNYYVAKYRDGDSYIETPIFIKDQFNIHIMTTPCRVVLTIHLMKHAIQQDYNPVCIGLYQSEIHIRYRNKSNQVINKKFCDLNLDSSSKEVNNKIHEIVEYLKSMGESIERPFIVLGNYKPTGESITFVNYKYGTIRSDTLLPVVGETREMHYQGFLRCCYMDTKFREQNPHFVHPAKFIIGSDASINNAVAYEKENDERVQNFSSGCNPLLIQPVVPAAYAEEEVTGISSPCKITVEDTDDSQYTALRSILEKATRNEKDRKQILKLLCTMIEKKTALFDDPTEKFDFKTYTLQEVRTYKDMKLLKDEQEKERKYMERANKMGDKYVPFEADYRFKEYQSKHEHKMPYMNNKSKWKQYDCELLAAFDKYEYDGIINHKRVIWLSYKYA